MLKRLFSLVLFLILYSLFAGRVSAQSEFLIDAKVEYRIQTSGKTLVTQTITLENAFSNLYATSYSLTLENIQPEAIYAYQDGKTLSLTQTKEENKVTLTVNFDDALVGKGKSRTFSIIFEESTFAKRTGEVWEITIPRLSEKDSFRGYQLSFVIPDSLGQEAYISPSPDSFTQLGGSRTYFFSKEAISESGITAGFGEFQVFSFRLNYHLENPLNKPATIEIATPPDTAYQRVYYEAIDPAPLNIRVDQDGNWLAIFNLKPREKLDVVATGSVQIFAGNRPYLEPTAESLNANLKESAYWQTNDVQIKGLSGRLLTPEAIYNYVWQNLVYDYGRVRPNVERIGAKGALLAPTSAICMEFTDLFIALTRAAGVPAREVNGYAYTENPELQPLSLVADVLHAWPEYWNPEKKSWVPVDPTWASTTEGTDYFNKLDLRHFTFVIHGTDPTKPYPPGSYKLGPDPQKDVFVSFGQLPEKKASSAEISYENKRNLPFASNIVTVTLKNPGPVALYYMDPKIYFDNILQNSYQIPVLPPYSTYEVEVPIPFSFFGKGTPDNMVVVAGGSSTNIPTFKNQVVTYNILALFLIISLLVVLILIRLGKIRLWKARIFKSKETP